MSTVTYKNQPGTAAALKAGTPLAGTSHVYVVNKVLWPEAVERHIETLLIPRTLHVCAGKSQLGDVRLDLYDDTADVKADAASLPFEDEAFETVLADPPYNGRLQWNHDMLSELSRVARSRIIFQHWFIPADIHGRWKKFHRFRLSSVFVWQPRTYFGRVQVISVFDADTTPEPGGSE